MGSSPVWFALVTDVRNQRNHHSAIHSDAADVFVPSTCARLLSRISHIYRFYTIMCGWWRSYLTAPPCSTGLLTDFTSVWSHGFMVPAKEWSLTRILSTEMDAWWSSAWSSSGSCSTRSMCVCEWWIVCLWSSSCRLPKSALASLLLRQHQHTQWHALQSDIPRSVWEWIWCQHHQWYIRLPH